MKPEYEPKTREQLYGHLIEECGEVLQAAGKTLRWGEMSTNPELPVGDRETNISWLKREMKDLRGAIDRMEMFLGTARFHSLGSGTEPRTANVKRNNRGEISDAMDRK